VAFTQDGRSPLPGISHWVDEGIQNAKTAVYVNPVGLGSGPFSMTIKYKKDAKALARKQVVLADARLANLLNAELIGFATEPTYRDDEKRIPIWQPVCAIPSSHRPRSGNG
jgi:hypothetical protein